MALFGPSVPARKRGRRGRRAQPPPAASAALSMKRGRPSSCHGSPSVPERGLESCSSLYGLLLGTIRSDGSLLGRSISIEGRLRDQSGSGTCRSKRLGAGEHVPVRLGELARDLDARHLGAALAAEAALGGLVVRGVGGVAGGVNGGLDQGPAQVLGAVLGERPAAVGGARLVD